MRRQRPGSRSGEAWSAAATPWDPRGGRGPCGRGGVRAEACAAPVGRKSRRRAAGGRRCVIRLRLREAGVAAAADSRHAASRRRDPRSRAHNLVRRRSQLQPRASLLGMGRQPARAGAGRGKTLTRSPPRRCALRWAASARRRTSSGCCWLHPCPASVAPPPSSRTHPLPSLSPPSPSPAAPSLCHH
jgi:hypothetical protein